MASLTNNRKFINDVVPKYLLDDAIDWIKINLKPEDVFGEEELENWAIKNSFYKIED